MRLLHVLREKLRLHSDRKVSDLVLYAATRDDTSELVRLAWSYRQTAHAAEIEDGLRRVAGRLEKRRDAEALSQMLNLPGPTGVPIPDQPGIAELIRLGPEATPRVLAVASHGTETAKLRAATILEATGSSQAAAELRQKYARGDDSERAHATDPLDDFGGGALTIFRPRRWRVFVWMSATFAAAFGGAAAIEYAVLRRPPSMEYLIIICTYFVSGVSVQTWRVPRHYAAIVSDTVIGGGRPYIGVVKRIPLTDLDRARSARRSRLDRLLGRQNLYSTKGKRLYLWRAMFDAADFRELLDLLRVDQANLS